MPELTDEQLFESYRARGDQAALQTLIDRHHDDLYRFLYRLVGSAASADDVFQETFLQIHLSAHTFDADRRFRPWLFTIAANKGRDHLRKQNRRRTLDLSASVGGDDGVSFVDLLEIDIAPPDSALEESERDAMVQDAVDQLTPTMREILLLAYFQRLSYAQISEELQIPIGTVKSRLHAAVGSFAKAWKRRTRGQPGS